MSGNYQNLAAFDMSAFENEDTTNTAPALTSTTSEEMTDDIAELSNPLEAARLSALHNDYDTLQSRISQIHDWYKDPSTLPTEHKDTHLGFLLSGLSEHQAKVKELVGYYESIAENERYVKGAKEAGDSEGAEETEEEMKEARDMIAKREGDLAVFRQKYPDY